MIGGRRSWPGIALVSAILVTLAALAYANWFMIGTRGDLIASYWKAHFGDSQMQQSLYFSLVTDPPPHFGPDLRQGAYWMERAAAAGDPFAQTTTGFNYLDGIGGPKDPGRALEWFERAAEGDYPLAVHALSMVYLDGLGVDPDPERAADYLVRAAELGSPDAQLELALRFLDEDSQEHTGIAWLRRAASSGSGEAAFRLSLAFRDGMGVPRDPSKARDWACEAYRLGISAALALC